MKLDIKTFFGSADLGSCTFVECQVSTNCEHSCCICQDNWRCKHVKFCRNTRMFFTMLDEVVVGSSSRANLILQRVFRRQSDLRRPCRLRHINAADVPLPSTGPNFNAEGKTQILEACPRHAANAGRIALSSP